MKYLMIVTMLMSVAWGDEKIDIACWDGSFAYGVVSLFEHEENLEVGLTSSLLGIKSVTTNNGEVKFDNWTTGKKLLVNFNKAECTILAEEHVVCEKKTIAMGNTKSSPRIYVSEKFYDLDKHTEVISWGLLKEITLEFIKGENVKLTLKANNQNLSNQVAEIFLKMGTCRKTGAPGFPIENLFPNRLREYVASHPRH